MKTVTFFSTREELRELTGLPADDHDAALWDSGFDLDDWDFGFVSDTEWHEVDFPTFVLPINVTNPDLNFAIYLFPFIFILLLYYTLFFC